MKRYSLVKYLLLIIILFVVFGKILDKPLLADARFPRPQFESEYQQPKTTTPEPRRRLYEIVDIIVLGITLALATFFALWKRSRNALFLITLFSIVYFGFWRQGCVCAIGAIQNMTLFVADRSYIVPISVIIFFTLPLLFTLFFGRTFCSSVCPLGAIQDVMVLRPKKIPAWLSQPLALIPHIYLGLAVLFAATKTTFLICRFDPFIGFYRISANFGMIIFGIIILSLGVFIARPYCRFLCPYGVLLGWMSRFSRFHVTITPSECINCRLCEDSCPFDVINIPAAQKFPDNIKPQIKSLSRFLLIAPLIIILAAWTGSHLDIILSKMHSTVRLAERIRLENSGEIKEENVESTAFRESGTPLQVLFDDAQKIQHQFRIGGAILGAYLALVISLKILGLYKLRYGKIYEPDKSNCLSCGRCFDYCPVDQSGQLKRDIHELAQTNIES